MPDELDLIRRYARTGDEAAFSQLVRERIDFVHAAALRQVRDPQLAEEVTQDVFLSLARKARGLENHPNLGGWLFNATRFTAKTALRGSRRRRIRELEAHMESPENAAPDWASVSPVLDDILHGMPERDREALILRYLEDRPAADLGRRWGIAENAARMRVERAVERLRVQLGRRGITSSTGALSALLAGRAVAAAPAGLAAKVSAGVAAGANAGLGLGFFEAMKIVTRQKLLFLAAAGILEVGLFVALDNRAVAAIAAEEREQNRLISTLRAEAVAARTASAAPAVLPAPPPAPVGPAIEPTARLRAMSEVVTAGGLTGRLAWEAGSLAATIDRVGKLSGLTAAELGELQKIGEATRARIFSSVMGTVGLERMGPQVSFRIQGSPEVREEFAAMLQQFAGVVGPQRFQYFGTLGFDSSLRTSLMPEGLGVSRQVRITRLEPAENGQPRYGLQEFRQETMFDASGAAVGSRGLISRATLGTGPFGGDPAADPKTRDEIEASLGPFAGILPLDF